MAEPLAVELHNTLRASAGELVDRLDGPVALPSWVAEVDVDLPGPVDGTRLDEILVLREAVRDALHAALDGRPVPQRLRRALNDAAARNPTSPELGRAGARVRHHGATATDVLLASLAASAIELVADPRDLRACGAPGCVLLFVKDHPRRAWCSAGCGNRARQARHYARTRVT